MHLRQVFAGSDKASRKKKIARRKRPASGRKRGGEGAEFMEKPVSKWKILCEIKSLNATLTSVKEIKKPTKKRDFPANFCMFLFNLYRYFGIDKEIPI